MFLTPDELRALTGSPRRTRQIAWLSKHGWRFTVNYRGLPIVAQAEMRRQLVGGEPKAPESAIRWGEVKHGRKAA